MSDAHLYSLEISPPSLAAKMALDHKGVTYETTELTPGIHPPILRALGFKRSTVPALKIDGSRVQGTREITSYLERTRPVPPLFGTSPEERARIEEAEKWGEQELQSIPRRVLRNAMTRDYELRRWLAEGSGLPVPAVAAHLTTPVAHLMARAADANDDRVRTHLAELPATLDRLDALVADGTIGGETANAADMQILTTVRSMSRFTDLAPFLAGRPVLAAAERLVPALPGPVPSCVPAEWLPAPTQTVQNSSARGRSR